MTRLSLSRCVISVNFRRRCPGSPRTPIGETFDYRCELACLTAASSLTRLMWLLSASVWCSWAASHGIVARRALWRSRRLLSVSFPHSLCSLITIHKVLCISMPRTLPSCSHALAELRHEPITLWKLDFHHYKSGGSTASRFSRFSPHYVASDLANHFCELGFVHFNLH